MLACKRALSLETDPEVQAGKRLCSSGNLPAGS